MPHNGVSVRENFLKAARRQQPAWVPLDFGMSRGAMRQFHEQAGQDANPCEYFKFDGAWLGPAGTRRATPDWKSLYYNDGSLPEGATIDPEWGTAHLYDPASDDQMDFLPLRNITMPRRSTSIPGRTPPHLTATRGSPRRSPRSSGKITQRSWAASDSSKTSGTCAALSS